MNCHHLYILSFGLCGTAVRLLLLTALLFLPRSFISVCLQKQKSGMTILVAQYFRGPTYPITCASSDTILDIKQIIRDASTIPIVNQRLTLDDQELEDGQTLGHCNVHEGSNLCLELLEL